MSWEELCCCLIIPFGFNTTNDPFHNALVISSTVDVTCGSEQLKTCWNNAWLNAGGRKDKYLLLKTGWYFVNELTDLWICWHVSLTPPLPHTQSLDSIFCHLRGSSWARDITSSQTIQTLVGNCTTMTSCNGSNMCWDELHPTACGCRNVSSTLQQTLFLCPP